MIRITSKQAGFRRGGIAHPAEATDYLDDALSQEQLDLIESEPMLVVERLADDGQAPAPVPTPAKKPGQKK